MLNGKTAVVTGASRGIGKAIALKLASAGANIAVVYAASSASAEEVCREAEKLGVKAVSYKCDVSNFDETKEIVSAILKEFDSIDILVNNAGITRDTLIFSMCEEAFDAVIGTNLKGTFNMIKHVSPVFLKKRAGKIINISSVVGLIGNGGQANYAASKAGIIGLTKTIAKELAGRNVCCNAVAPGFIDTEMTNDLSKDKLLEAIPMKKTGQPNDVAELVLFLASDKSDYITGEVIRVDGGMAM